MKRKINIAAPYNETIEVSADVYGPIAVTPSVETASGYRITHVASGYAMSGIIDDKKKAMALARRMSKYPEVWAKLSTKRNTRNNKAAAVVMKRLAAEVGIFSTHE